MLAAGIGIAAGQCFDIAFARESLAAMSSTAVLIPTGGRQVYADGAELNSLLDGGKARVPTPGGVPRGNYDPSRQLYNWHAGNTAKTRTALERVRLDGPGMRINCFGPSTVAGYTEGGRSEFSAWPAQLRRILEARYGESGTGSIFFMESDTRLKLYSPYWSRQPYGPFAASCWHASDPSAVMTFGPARATVWSVLYLQVPGAGRFTMVSDIPGQYPIDVDCNGPLAVKRANIPASPQGTCDPHTVTIRANGPIFILMIDGWVGKSDWGRQGVQVNNVGMGSTVAANLINGDSWHGSSLGASIDANAADLSILAFIENSYGYQTPEAMKADYRILVDRMLASGSDVLLVTSTDWRGTADTYAPQPRYDDAVWQLADEYDLPLFDLAARWGAEETSPQFYYDRVHHSYLGDRDIGRALFDILHTAV